MVPRRWTFRVAGRSDLQKNAVVVVPSRFAWYLVASPILVVFDRVLGHKRVAIKPSQGRREASYVQANCYYSIQRSQHGQSDEG